jgi:hypothetical protein
MSNQKAAGVRVTIGALLLLCVADTAASQDAAAPEPDEWTKPVPLSVSVDYTLTTDYIFRGINFSEYSGEGREDLNHQLGVSVEYDAEALGAFGASVWFEWFAGQEALTPGQSSNLQEVDYSAYWSYEVEAIATTLELGYLAYHFPRLSGDAGCTHEWYASLSFDDSAWFGTDAPVLNPAVTFYDDVDDFRGSWFEIGVSHDFALADYDVTAEAPLLKDLTLTPSLTLGIDHRWMGPAVGSSNMSTRLGNLVYGLDAVCDLSTALEIPEPCGDLSAGGFLYYSQAFRDELINDEFWGGMTLSWSW